MKQHKAPTTLSMSLRGTPLEGPIRGTITPPPPRRTGAVLVGILGFFVAIATGVAVLMQSDVARAAMLKVFAGGA